MGYLDAKASTFESIVANLDTDMQIKAINEFFEGEYGNINKGVHHMEDFDAVCYKLGLCPMQIAEAVHDGDFHTYHSYFRYDGSEFTSTDRNPIDLVDFEGEGFVKYYEQMYPSELSDIGIEPNELIKEFCSYYDVDENKLLNHPNFDMGIFIRADWDTYLEDDEMEECYIKDEEDYEDIENR